MGSVEIGALIAVVGCFVGLAGWLAGRDKKIAGDAEWRGKTDEKLDNIQKGVSGIDGRMAKMEGAISAHETRLSIIETKIGIENEK